MTKAKRVKIAIVPQPMDMIFPPMQSAIGIWTYEVARRLAQLGEVIVYSGRLRKNVESDQGVQYRSISPTADRWLLRLLKRFAGLYRSRHPLFASALFYWRYALQVAIDLQKRQCDIVHLHNLSQFVSIIRAFNPNIKIVLHMHCEWLSQLDPAMIERRLHQVDGIVGCSEYITKKIRDAFPRLAARCDTVPNGVDANHFCRRNGHLPERNTGVKRLFYVGRVSPEKGLHVLIDAFRQVVARHPEARLEIIGPEAISPPEFIVALSDDPRVSALAQFYGKSYLMQLQERLPAGPANGVTFSGAFPYARLVERYCEGEVFVFPSVCHEAFGMPIIEAMACEVPVIATRSGGMTEIIEEGKTGLLVERGDSAALAQAILLLLANDDLRRTMGTAARQRVLERFSWDRISAELHGKYERILGNTASQYPSE